MKLKFANALSLALIMAMLFTSVGLASSVDVAVVDVTVPTGSVTLAPGGSGTITINMTVTGNQLGTATFEVNRNWTLSGGVFTGSNPQQFTVNPRSAGDPATTFSTSGTVTVAVGQASGGPFTLAVSAFDITNSNATGAKLADGADSNYKVTVSAPVNTAPSLSLPSNIIGEATGASGSAVTYIATASDTQDGSLTPSCSPASGATFALGTTTVNCSVTDSGGMSASGAFTVTIKDTTPPSLNLPSTINAEATSGSGATVNYSASATDLVDGAVAINCSPASGSTFALGTTPVSCSAADSRSNAASGSFNIIVSDTTGPVLSLPNNITQEATSSAGAVVSYVASASDVVDGPITPSCSPASGSTFGLGTTSVSCSATDSHSNTSSGGFSVTVKDTTAPLIDPHGDETAEATSPGGAIVNYTSPATHDAVDGDGVASCSPASGSTFALGNTTVTCGKTDSAGNAATATTFVVHVVDTTDPIITFVSRTPANGNGWNNTDVIVEWSCTDMVGVVSASVTKTVSTEGENQSATGTCEDTSGNTAEDTQSGINIDTTAPSISAQRDTAANPNGWNNSDVAASYTASDALSGLDPLSSATGSFTFASEGAGQSHTFTVSDKAGNSASATVGGVNIDKTAPTISGAADRPANAAGWYNADVTVSFTCADALSGMDTCSSPSTLVEGAAQSVSGSATDKAGNSANATVSGINIDKTKPTIVAAATSNPNGNGWYKNDVTVHFTCADGLSGIPAGTCATDQVLDTEGAAVASTAQTVTDLAGNTSDASNVVTVKIDKTAPTASASASPAANANGWNNANVTVSFNGTDGLSGLDFCDANVVLSTEGSGQSASGTCTDKAGNVSAPASKSGINIDKTAPSVSLVGGPANSGSYYFGSVPAAPTCSASDGLSGLDGSCSVSGYSAALGSHTVTTSASDKAGNSASASATYSVLAWTLNGFYQPVDMGKLNIAKNGSTVPLKFEVFAGTTELTNTNIILGTFVQKLTCGSGIATDDIENYSTGGTSLRYDTTAGQFIFNWQTPKIAGNCYRVTLTTADGTAISADFKLK